MLLILNEEQQMLRDLASRFLREHGGISMLRTLRDNDDPLGYSGALWSEIAELGWPAILVPESFGGLQFGHVGMGQIMEQTGRTLTASPLFSTAVVCASAIELAGTAAQKQALLPSVASGELTLAAAMDTAARSTAGGIVFSASSKDNGSVLNGALDGVPDGHCADKIVAVASHPDAAEGKGRFGIFVFDRNAPGVEVRRTARVDSRNASSLRLTNVALPAASMLGECAVDSALLERLHDIANAHLAAELSGLASESFERTVKFLKERKQFGVVIGSFQALQHRAAELWTEIELLKSAVLHAFQTLDCQDAASASACSGAKALACRVAERVTNEAIQMHGGVGMTDDYDVGLFLKRARVVQAQYGDHRYHADRFARAGGY